MAYLAIDPGTTTGWAVGHAGTTISGEWNLKGGRYEGGGMRFVRLRGLLDQLHAGIPITQVAYEEVRRHAGTDAAHVYGGIQAVLTAWCEEREIPYEAIPVGTIKKHWTGKGNASKDAMMAEAFRRKLEPQGDNEADALALLDLLLERDRATLQAEVARMLD